MISGNTKSCAFTHKKLAKTPEKTRIVCERLLKRFM
jgi:hypothetical protein